MGRPPFRRRWRGPHPISGRRLARLSLGPSARRSRAPGARRARSSSRRGFDTHLPGGAGCTRGTAGPAPQWTVLTCCRIHRGCALLLLVGLNQTAVRKEVEPALRTAPNLRFAGLLAVRATAPPPPRGAWPGGETASLCGLCCCFLLSGSGRCGTRTCGQVRIPLAEPLSDSSLS